MLYPAVAEAAHRAGANAVGLVDVGTSVGFNLHVDRVGISYSDGRSLGDPASPVQVACSLVGGRPVPTRSMAEVVARVGVGPEPLDLTDADDLRWLRSCTEKERAEEVEAEIALAATVSRALLRGDAVELLPDAIARVPANAMPVVITTWALSRSLSERRLELVRRLREAAAGRTVAWVSVEGVGVAPVIPTLGDRRASGHSILGLAVLDGSGRKPEAIGRCWSRGRYLAWLVDP